MRDQYCNALENVGIFEPKDMNVVDGICRLQERIDELKDDMVWPNREIENTKGLLGRNVLNLCHCQRCETFRHGVNVR